jgi:antitoxin (DNA-binding transcriptional repressor) of toxin-antitoxin stability system
MITVTVDEVQRDLAGYLERVKAGETLVVLDANQPIAEIKPLPHPGSELRPYGLAAGQFRVPDDFDEPLPPEIIEQFEGR